MFIPLNVNLGKVPKVPNGRHILPGNGEIWIVDGKKHRIVGPAEKRGDGYEAYFCRGLRHRTNGPAVTYPDGTQEFWERGKFIRRVKAPSESKK